MPLGPLCEFPSPLENLPAPLTLLGHRLPAHTVGFRLANLYNDVSQLLMIDLFLSMYTSY